MHRFDYFILSTSLIFLSQIRIARARQKTELDCLNNKNPCKNGGSCSISTNRCFCSPGFSGDLCELSEPEVKCLSDRIEVHIQKSWAAHYAKVQSAEQLYIGSENSNLENCKAVDFDHENYIITVDGENSCGTEINRDSETLDFVYSNSVYSNRFKQKQLDDETGHDKSPLFGLSSLMKRLPAFRLMSLVQWTCYYQHKDRPNTKSDKTHEIDEILRQEKIQFSNILPNSKASVEIQTFDQPIWTSEQKLHPKSYKKSISGKSVYFEVSTTENFLIQECALVNKPGEKQKNLEDPNYHQKVLVNSGGCVVPAQTSANMPVTQIITNSPQKLRFAVILERKDWLEIGYENLDPTVYVHCIVQEAKLEKSNQNGCSENTPVSHDGFVEIEAGPFQILKEITEEQATSVEIDGGDEEHSMGGIRSRPRSGVKDNFKNSPPIEIIYEILNSLENDAGETKEKAWEKMKVFIENYEMSELKEMPLVKLSSNYQLDENSSLNSDPHEIPVFSIVKVVDNEKIKAKLQTMVILAITIGCIFILLVATPVIITCYRNRNKKEGGDPKAKGKKTVDVPRSPVEKAVETMKHEDNSGLDVHHDLVFVEYADHVHDLVWGGVQQEQAGWIKHQSIDAQSIDISTSKPYDSSYDSAVPIPPPRVILPSYVVLGKSGSHNGPGPRKISDQLQVESITVEDNLSSSNCSSGHRRRGSIKLAGITIFGSCSGAARNAVPYKFKEKKRGAHV